MPKRARRAEFGAGIARLLAMVRRRPLDGPASDPPEIDRRSPEQRILDTAARYRDLRPVDATGRRPRSDQRRGSPTITTVPPTELSDAEGPTWVRRLDGRMAVMPTLPGSSLQTRATSGAERHETARRGDHRPE
jgi:hypothetical protein